MDFVLFSAQVVVLAVEFNSECNRPLKVWMLANMVALLADASTTYYMSWSGLSLEEDASWPLALRVFVAVGGMFDVAWWMTGAVWVGQSYQGCVR